MSSTFKHILNFIHERNPKYYKKDTRVIFLIFLSSFQRYEHCHKCLEKIPCEVK